MSNTPIADYYKAHYYNFTCELQDVNIFFITREYLESCENNGADFNAFYNTIFVVVADRLFMNYCGMIVTYAEYHCDYGEAYFKNIDEYIKYHKIVITEMFG